jgi:hypothetical protein
LALVWAVPFGLLILTIALRFVLVATNPKLPGIPKATTLIGAGALEILSSPLWVGLGLAFTYLFGGTVVIALIKLLSSNKLLRRKFVISASKKKDLEMIANAKEGMGNAVDAFSFKSFGKALGLTLGLNLAYTLFIQRYFESYLHFHSNLDVGSYLLLPEFIIVEFGIAVLFLPLLEIVLPLVVGKIRIRLVDSFPLDFLWLGYVYSAAGGASLVLFVLNILEHKTGSITFIVATLFVYALVSWYTALGSILAIPFTERKLARGLLSLYRAKNIYFGGIFVGRTREEAEEV